MEIVPRLFRVPDQSFFLFGPRGTGKSTWLRHELPQALFIDLLQPEVFRQMSAHPERLREMVLASPDKDPVVVDEVQRVPELVNVVRDLRESAQRPRFVLTASSVRKLRREGPDLLTGRALIRSLHPFMAAELDHFRLEDALALGLLPLVVAAPRPAEALKAYATLYLELEVQAEGLTRKVGNFARFLEAVSFSHACVLNVSDVARECMMERKTMVNYLAILEDLLLCFRLPVFSRRAGRETASHPKFYLFDVGVYRSLRPSGTLDRPEEIEGAALEGLVAQHLRGWAAYSGAEVELSCWRTRSGVEVDFVVYGRDIFQAIDVKNTARIRLEDLRPLRSFAEDHPSCLPLLLYRGGDPVQVQGVWCLPVDAFLRELLPSKIPGHPWLPARGLRVDPLR